MKLNAVLQQENGHFVLVSMTTLLSWNFLS